MNAYRLLEPCSKAAFTTRTGLTLDSVQAPIEQALQQELITETKTPSKAGKLMLGPTETVCFSFGVFWGGGGNEVLFIASQPTRKCILCYLPTNNCVINQSIRDYLLVFVMITVDYGKDRDASKVTYR